MSTVIAAIAGSDATRPVMIMARAVAHALDASVEALHVKEGNGETELTAAAGAPVRVLSGDPVEVLPLVAAEQDVLALVVGARSQPGSPRRVGDLARSLADRTDKPVVVVPLGYRPPERLHTVVVAMEGSPGKARALQRSIAISARAGLEIVVVHVQDEDSIPSFSDQVQHEAEEYAEEFFSRHLIGAPKMRLELRIGTPANEVLAAIESSHADLVAVGWPRTDDPGRGAVAKEILDRSPVAVLLVAVT